jgi:hypothetical protein
MVGRFNQAGQSASATSMKTTYDFAKRDFLNTEKFLVKSGFIVLQHQKHRWKAGGR